MKTRFLKTIFGAALLPAALSAICLPENSGAQTPPDDATQPASPDTLPADILPASPLAQVVQLAQSGVDEAVILAYVNNSSSPFNLTSDQIIYLKDLGLPNDAVTAMIQRDQQLGATAPAAPAAPAPAPDTTVQTETPPQPAAVTQNYFYDTLSPYGGWVNVDGYGLCWQPTVVVYDSNWQPYCDHGHWVYTDDGWYWLSDYSWGATAFHYGRWFHDPRHGWCWWPDTAWAPSWVTWRYADDYSGWAPLPPHTVYREGVGIFYNGVAVSAGFDFGLNVNFFTFVPTKNFNDPHPRRYRVEPGQVAQIYNHTTIINNFNVDSRSHAIINVGIPPQRITAVTRTEIRPVAIRETSAPVARGEQLGRNGQTLEVNRPQFNASAVTTLNNGVRPHPTAPAQNNFSQPNRSFNNPQTPSQNNFQRPSAGYNPQTGAPVQTLPVVQPQAPQNRNYPPATTRPANQYPQPNHNPAPGQTPSANQPHFPQNNNALPQTVAPVVRNPQAGSPVQTTPPNNNYDRNGTLQPPRTQTQPPHIATPAPEPALITPSIITPPQPPQMNSAPRIEQRPDNEPPSSTVAPPATQNEQPRNSPPGSSAPSGQQKSGRDKNQNGPGN
jgi:hypothetical protein